MRKLTALFVFLIVLLSMSCSQKLQESLSNTFSKEEINKQKRDMDSFLEGAIFYGLKKDRFPTQVAEKLLDENDNWVGKCPICDNVRHGMRKYLREVKNNEATLISKKEQEEFSSQNSAERRLALKKLVDRYTQAYFSSLDMTEIEYNEMQEKLVEGRKTGMSRANGGEGFFCPSCDGACHVKSNN